MPNRTINGVNSNLAVLTETPYSIFYFTDAPDLMRGLVSGDAAESHAYERAKRITRSDVASTNYTLDCGACEDIAQKLLTMGSHYNQIRVDRCSRSQYAIKGMALDHDRIAMNVLQLRHGRDLLNQRPLRLTLFDADQFRWLILVDDMNNVQFCIRGAHQEAGLPQSAIGPRREICRGDDVHVRLLMIANGRQPDGLASSTSAAIRLPCGGPMT